ncbi:MAG: RNA polymerase sigma factor SigJ [Nitrospirota bacterium]|nr:RNA polymerase sigma factor SigJ [Nitrospirota bacterium]
MNTDFENIRQHLIRLAYRMLGSVSEAEDVVQDAWLRWQSAGEPHLDFPRAWFTKTCTRLCLDRFKSAQRAREEYFGEWLPEPILTHAHERDRLDESLSMALLLTVQRLRPTERAAFLLHDVFGYTFDEVAEILELESANCRQLAVRARRHLKSDALRSETDQVTVQRLSEAFFQAIHDGDMDSLQSVLTENVVMRTDGGGKAAAAKHPLKGIAEVTHFLYKVFVAPTRPPSARPRFVWFNGAPGALLLQDGQPVSAFHFQVVDDRINAIFVQRNPDKLMVFNGFREASTNGSKVS